MKYELNNLLRACKQNKKKKNERKKIQHAHAYIKTEEEKNEKKRINS